MNPTYEDLIAALRQEVIQLRQWAVESRSGGWSTHQVAPMRRRADDLDDLIVAAERQARIVEEARSER